MFNIVKHRDFILADDLTTCGNLDRQLAAPPDNLLEMQPSTLKKSVQQCVSDLRHLQEQFDGEFFEAGHKYPSKEKGAATCKKYAAIYDLTFAEAAYSLAPYG